MSIIRSPRAESNFSIISNAVIRDQRLSYRARGILLEILSRPDNWRVSADSLARSGAEGRHAILTALKELRDVGYMRTQKLRKENGQFETVSIVFDYADGSTGVQKPDSGYPESENRTPLEELSKKNLDKGSAPDGAPVKELMKIYYENFTGELEPGRGQTAGQIQAALKTIPLEKLAPIVKQVALEGQIVTRNTLIYAMKKMSAPAPTPVPERYDRSEYEESQKRAVPMPEELRNLLRSL